MIEDLSSRLAAAGLDPTLYELRDALWLSRYITLAGQRTSQVDTPEASDNLESDSTDLPNLIAEDTATANSTTTDVYGEMYATGAESGSSLRGASLRSPAVLALPRQLELARALRPFGRRVPSRRSFEVDEDATATQVAEEGLWAPVLRPAPERWLSLTIVVDIAPSMVVWQRTILELHNLCTWVGAFRQIRLRSFDSAATDQLADPLHNLDPTRHVVMVVTDAVGPAWHDGRAVSLLNTWGGVVPTSVVTVLPQSMWSGTGLNASAARIVVPRPATPNTEWRATAAGAVPIPVFELSPRWLTLWARLTTGAATSRQVALLAAPTTRSAATNSSYTAQGLVRRFRSVASPEAFRLATYLSAAWLTLPVMRLVQRVMLPDTTIAHLAEVFLSGLLQQNTHVSDPEAVEYDFTPEVRAELNSYLLRDDALTVLREASEFVSERLGQPFSFAAMLADPEGVELSAVGADGRSPMAYIAAEVLTRLGGRYRALAGRLTAVQVSTTPEQLGAANDVTQEGSIRIRTEPTDTVVVLTVLESEYTAVRDLIETPEMYSLPDGTLFEVGRIRERAGRIALALVGRGNQQTAVLTERAIAEFQPRAVFFAGIAGALHDDLELGTVVVATKIYAYDSGLEEDTSFSTRPRALDANHELEQIARVVSRDSTWHHGRLGAPAVSFRPIMAGEVVLNSNEMPLAQQLRRHYADAAAVEMESAGSANTAHLNRVPFLTVRGISDKADRYKHEPDGGGWQSIAAANAAAFTIAVAAELLAARRPERTNAPSAKSYPPSIAPVSRTIVAIGTVEIAQNQSNAVKASNRRAMYDLVERALTSAGINSDLRDRFIDRGNCLIALVHPSDRVPKSRVLTKFIPMLNELLSELNSEQMTRLRMRVAIHSGDVGFDELGVFGEEIDIALRLLDAIESGHPRKANDSPLTVVISEQIHRSVVRHGFDSLKEADFQPVALQSSDIGQRAWVQRAH